MHRPVRNQIGPQLTICAARAATTERSTGAVTGSS